MAGIREQLVVNLRPEVRRYPISAIKRLFVTRFLSNSAIIIVFSADLWLFIDKL